MENKLFDIINMISNFQGNPQQIANQILSSGKFTEEQIAQAKKKASQLESALNMLGFKGR